LWLLKHGFLEKIVRILFIKRRNHTNFWPAFDALESAGHEVYVTSVIQHRNQVPSDREILLKESRLADLRSSKLLPPRISALLSDYAGADLREAIRKTSPDLVVVKGETKLLSLEAARYARSKRIPVLLYNQHPLNTQSSRAARVMRAFVTKNRQWFTPVLGPGDGTPESGGVHLPFCQPYQEHPVLVREHTEPLRVLMLGQFHMKRKNHLSFLRTINELKSKVPLSIIIAGPAGEKDPQLMSCQNFIKENSLQSVVQVITDIKYDSISKLYKWAHLYVLPSDDEPAAVSIAEAMSFGLPVMCNDSNETRCYFRHGLEGFVFPKGDWAALGELIVRIAGDEKMRFQMGLEAQKTSRLNHSPKRWLQSFELLAAQAV
jgi:glycosyltransferase involved in cell wall biosynthesis